MSQSPPQGVRRPAASPTETSQQARAAGSPPATERPSGPDAATLAANRAAASLLALEVELRSARTLAEIRYFAANEPRLVTRAQQIFVFGPAARGRLRVDAITAVTTVDRSAPLVAGMEAIVATLQKHYDLTSAREVDASALSNEHSDIRDSYPLAKLLWVPYLDLRGKVIGGALQARSTPWTQQEITISEHVAGSVARSLLALNASARRARRPEWLGTRTLVLAGVWAALLLFLPVSMSALAPVEVVPLDPYIVTSGSDGVIETVHVEPNATVRAGDVLAELASTLPRNRLEVAEHQVLIAEANLKKARQLAFVDVRGRHDLASAEAELALKAAERDFAKEMLERSVIRADRDGVVLFASKSTLLGKPVATGEKLMEIVDPAKCKFSIVLPVADAIVLQPGARVTVFLDSDPLNPIEARLDHADFKARPDEQQQLGFKIIAMAPPNVAGALRLGVRGTAQVRSGKVKLGFYLFRRPISAFRQWTGF